MLFEEAYELYSSAFEVELTVPDRTNFRDELLSSEIGLPVTVFTWNNVTYIVLNPVGWNVVSPGGCQTSNPLLFVKLTTV